MAKAFGCCYSVFMYFDIAMMAVLGRTILRIISTSEKGLKFDVRIQNIRNFSRLTLINF